MDSEGRKPPSKRPSYLTTTAEGYYTLVLVAFLLFGSRITYDNR